MSVSEDIHDVFIMVAFPYFLMILHINLRKKKAGHELCYPRSRIQCITADNAKWQNVYEQPTFYAVKQTKENYQYF
jgi:hypothetical protein